jgi:hypothetical protein
MPNTVDDDRYFPEEITYLEGAALTAAKLLDKLDFAHEDKRLLQ